MESNPNPYQPNPQQPYYQPPAGQQPFYGHNPQPTQQQPVLLIVLCILTLIGSFISFGSNCFAIITMLSDSSISMVTEMRGGWILLLSAPFALMSLGRMIGAILMLTRRKAGLMIYTFSEVISAFMSILQAILSMVYFGFMMGSMPRGMGLGAAGPLLPIIFLVFSLAFSALFLILYWMQRKHLR